MHIRKASFVALLAVVVMAFTVPTEALAQDTSQVQPLVQQETGQVTFESLMAALSNISAETAEVEAATGLSAASVQVVPVSSLQGADMNALSSAVSQNQADIEALRTSLESNTAITDALKANGVAASDVVAVDVLSGGEVVVFVQPQQDM